MAEYRFIRHDGSDFTLNVQVYGTNIPPAVWTIPHLHTEFASFQGGMFERLELWFPVDWRWPAPRHERIFVYIEAGPMPFPLFCARWGYPYPATDLDSYDVAMDWLEERGVKVPVGSRLIGLCGTVPTDGGKTTFP